MDYLMREDTAVARAALWRGAVPLWSVVRANSHRVSRSRMSPVVSCLAMILLWAALAQQAFAEVNWDFPEFQQATEAYRRGDCDTAWKLMWPLAREGKYEAIYFLSAVVTNGRVIPPGRADSSQRVLIWHMLTLSAYTAAGPEGPKPFQGYPNRWARNDIPIFIRRLSFGAAGDEVSECYRSTRALKECLDFAIAKGVVEPFASYVAKVDADVQTGPSDAICRPRH